MRTTKKLAASVLSAALAASFCLAGCAGSAQPASDQDTKDATVKVGLMSGSYLSVPVLVAKEMGYFEEEGLTVDWQDVSTDGTAMIATGDLDFYNTGYSSALSGIAQGEKNVTIIGGEMSEGCDYVVKKDFKLDKISSAKDFESLKIGVCTGDPGYYMTQAFLKDGNVNAKFIELGSVEDTVSALNKGEVDMSIVCGAMSYDAIKDGCKVLAKVSDETGTFPCCRIQANTEFLQNNHGAAVKYMRAALRGYETYVNDPDKTTDILAQVSGQDKESVKARMYGTGSYDTPMKVSIDPEADAVIAADDAFKAAGIVQESSTNLKEFIETGPYKEALDGLATDNPNDKLWSALQADYQDKNSSVL